MRWIRPAEARGFCISILLLGITEHSLANFRMYLAHAPGGERVRGLKRPATGGSSQGEKYVEGLQTLFQRHWNDISGTHAAGFGALSYPPHAASGVWGPPPRSSTGHKPRGFSRLKTQRSRGLGRGGEILKNSTESELWCPHDCS